MRNLSVLAVGASAAVLIGAAPAKTGGSTPPPVASYWMDVSTTSGLGAGLMGGGRPNMGQIMAMMNGGGTSSVGHMLSLRLSSREKPTGAPEANHFIPAGMQMGESLPLLTPQIERVQSSGGADEGGSYEKPRGRMLIYWGCGEHAASGEPMVIDFAKVAAGQIPPGLQALAKMGRMMGRMAHEPTPENSAGFGEWPNPKDARQVPASASLVGAHRIEGNYAPAIAFTLGQNQDFMPGLGLREAGALASGAEKLDWTPAAQATGYALAMFGSSGNGDMVIWTSARSASLAPVFDYQTPSEVRQLVATGAALPPGSNECVLPAEVSRAVPQGMTMEIGYGPEAYFSDRPRAPTWTARVRYKTTAMLMRGIGGMTGSDDGGSASADQPPQQPPKKRKGIGLGGLLGAIPH
jgi:hypothetical protein